MTTLFGRIFAAVLFDLDGTLIDSTPAVERSWTRWASEYGIDPVALGNHHGVPSGETIARVLPADDVPAAAARIEVLEIADTDGVVALPGAIAALRVIPADRVGIVTSCTKELAAARMGAAGIAAPAVMVTRDRIARGKPDPEGFLLAARELGVDPGDCLAVEDAVAGLAAARAAGCARLALRTTTPPDRLEADADAVIDTLGEVGFVVTAGGVRVERR